jgi:hypothetical protein
MTSDKMKAKTKAFALSVLHAVGLLPRTERWRIADSSLLLMHCFPTNSDAVMGMA